LQPVFALAAVVVVVAVVVAQPWNTFSSFFPCRLEAGELTIAPPL